MPSDSSRRPPDSARAARRARSGHSPPIASAMAIMVFQLSARRPRSDGGIGRLGLADLVDVVERPAGALPAEGEDVGAVIVERLDVLGDAETA